MLARSDFCKKVKKEGVFVDRSHNHKQSSYKRLSKIITHNTALNLLVKSVQGGSDTINNLIGNIK